MGKNKSSKSNSQKKQSTNFSLILAVVITFLLSLMIIGQTTTLLNKYSITLQSNSYYEQNTDSTYCLIGYYETPPYDLIKDGRGWPVLQSTSYYGVDDGIPECLGEYRLFNGTAVVINSALAVSFVGTLLIITARTYFGNKKK